MPPQDRAVPQKPTADSNPDIKSGAGHIDLDKVLLPKKPVAGNTLESAQRVNAGALFEQEQNASLPKPEVPKAPPPPAAKPAEPMIPPLQTYKGDIESLIQTTNASSVSIAAAEAVRRAETPLAEPAPPFDWRGLLKRSSMILGGVVLLLVAGVVSVLVYNHLNATAPIPEAENAPFIAVDGTISIALPPGGPQRSTLMSALENARQENALSLGLIGRLVVYETIPGEEENTYVPLPTDVLMPTLAPNAPPELIRTLTGRSLLGMHTYEGTQAFLLLEFDSYEHGFAAMLAWERAMRGDLLPLFNYEPRVRIPEEGVATSSVGEVPQLIQTGFTDKIIDNRDTRAILNTSGDVLFLWAPLQPTLFVVTTNEYTFRELVSRLGL